MIDDIITDYKNNMFVNELCKKYHISDYKLYKILKENNIEHISILKRHNPNIIEDYFSNIDNPNKMYWIGFILTDGSISHKDHALTIGLQTQDKYILDIFESDLGIKNHVKYYNSGGYEHCEFCIKCKQYEQDLKKYGIIENKTLGLKFPYELTIPKYDSALIRGLFDGDGGFTLGYSTRYIKERHKSYTSPYSEFSFTGTYDMCDGFQNIILRNLNLSKKKINKNNSMFHVRWSNRDEILKICEFMYSHKNEHYLKRKFDKYQKLIMKDYL